jgi:DNA-binding transcriptional MerR regulator
MAGSLALAVRITVDRMFMATSSGDGRVWSHSRVNMNSIELKIGDVARRARVSVDTVRYYERLGLLRALGRTASGYRRFSAITVDRICFAKELQELGFSLEEIQAVLEDVDRGTAECAAERSRFEEVALRIDARIEELHKTRARIAQVLVDCRTGPCKWADRAREVAESRE